jgi:hypothetical protein
MVKQLLTSSKISSWLGSGHLCLPTAELRIAVRVLWSGLVPVSSR